MLVPVRSGATRDSCIEGSRHSVIAPSQTAASLRMGANLQVKTGLEFTTEGLQPLVTLVGSDVCEWVSM